MVLCDVIAAQIRSEFIGKEESIKAIQNALEENTDSFRGKSKSRIGPGKVQKT
jgi:hypothetical protein